MANVLADLAIDSEAATIAALRVARAYDSPQEGPFRRLATAVLKYWVCKRAALHAGEALECLGGNGYVEESGMPLLYRDAPLNSIWEASGQCLGARRAARRDQRARGAAGRPGRMRAGGGRRCEVRRHVRRRARRRCSGVRTPEDAQFQARHLVEDLALALQASLLLRSARRRSRTRSALRAWTPPEDGCTGRCRAGSTLRDHRSRAAGMSTVAAAIVDRALPA